jgi:hypothetical protein
VLLSAVMSRLQTSEARVWLIFFVGGFLLLQGEAGIFQRHRDGGARLRERRLMSYLTVMLYLNRVAEENGGATR